MTKGRLISEGRMAINRNVQLIQVCIALCPLFGLMGTVTGMIEVFQVMAFNGGGDARSMAWEAYQKLHCQLWQEWFQHYLVC